MATPSAFLADLPGQLTEPQIIGLAPLVASAYARGWTSTRSARTSTPATGPARSSSPQRFTAASCRDSLLRRAERWHATTPRRCPLPAETTSAPTCRCEPERTKPDDS